MTGKEILEEEFEKAGMRGGYRSEQVDAFLDKISKYVDEVNGQNKDLTYKIQILADKIDEYKKDEENIREALLGAQKLGSSMLNEARAKAEAMTRETKSATDEMMSQAKAKIDFLTKDSLQKATFEINASKREAERELKKLDSMKQEVSSFRSSILKQYKAHLDLLSNLPSVDNGEPIEEIQPKVHSEPIQSRPVQEISTPKPTFEKENFVLKPMEETAEHAISYEPQAEKQQTIKSDIITQEETELEQEEKLQTKEFDKKKRPANISAEQINDRGSVSAAIPFNPPQASKTNFAEKYGELAFGNFKDKQ